MVKSGTLTRFLRDSTERDMEAAAVTSKMAGTDLLADSQPQSPQLSECSLKSLEINPDLDIRDLLRNLPSKTDMERMIHKLESTLHSKMAEMGTEIQQLNLKVGDLEEEKDLMQAQITNIRLSHTIHVCHPEAY
ncbi:Hypothetical predicted protein [Pelobates cultripes]|uniref:Uncharacterized protein n=1 Tax=Pelobates cultripes TaxID=61616 RepID=A0AAD1VWH9_PELCU|nr:Hypothetical predicted protein [Pelobates cultripes]